MAGYRARQVAIALAAAGAVAVYAQDEQPAPTFRSEINYVQLPVRVLDARGQFVSGLTAADFQILEDGRPQTITAFTAVDIPFIPVDESVPAAPLSGLDAVASNDVPEVDGRVYLFVLDDFSAEAGDTLKVRNLMHSFIDKRLSANDLAAISLLSGSRSQNFTRNRQLLHDAVNRFIGERDSDSDDSNPFNDARSAGLMQNVRRQQTISTITRMAEWLSSIKDRRKALVWVSSYPVCSLMEGDCRESVQHTLRVSMQSDVTIYVIDPTGLDRANRRSRSQNDNPNSRLTAGGSSEASSGAAARASFAEWRGAVRGPLDGARYLAEQSGGMALVNMNDLGPALDRMVADTSSYYLLGYHSTNNRTDGKFRRNQVMVRRGGVRVVHRNGYFAARQTPRAEPQLQPGRASVVAHLQELARSPLPVSAMPLRVSATPFLSTDKNARVAVVVEMPAEGLRPATDEGRYRLNVGLSIGFYDRRGKPVRAEEPNIDVDIPLETAPDVTSNGMRIVSRIAVPPGVYRLWVGAVQPASALGGSAMTEIAVPDFDKQPLMLSGIAVSSTEARRIYTARTDGVLDDVMGGPPVAHREFIRDADLSLYAEIYDRRSGGGEVTADVTVKAANGSVVYQMPLRPAPVQFGYLARIPLEEIGPGSFTATIEARSSAPGPVSATRSVAFRVK
jgi:VWFA-related protein